MVAKKIEDRYQTMTEVVTDLEKCQTAMSSASTSVFMPSKTTHNDEMSDLSMAMAHSPLRSIHSASSRSTSSRRRNHARPKPRRSQAKPKSSRPVLIGLVAAGVLGVVAVAAVIFTLKTKDGTLVVEVNQPDAVVQILDPAGKIEISRPGGLDPVAISVVPGKHTLRVEKDGFVVIAKEFEITSDEKLAVKARLVPSCGNPPGAGEQGGNAASGCDGSASAPWNKNPAFQAWVKTTQPCPPRSRSKPSARS